MLVATAQSYRVGIVSRDKEDVEVVPIAFKNRRTLLPQAFSPVLDSSYISYTSFIHLLVAVLLSAGRSKQLVSKKKNNFKLLKLLMYLFHHEINITFDIVVVRRTT